MRKIFLMSVLLIAALSISTISAADNNTQEIQTELETNTPGNSFEDIQQTINQVQNNSTITLNGTYVGKGKEITINKDLIFEGINNATLDANFKSEIFNIHHAKVIFKNLNIINAKSIKNGGAIYSTGELIISNCNFINNTSHSEYDGYFNTHNHDYELDEIGHGGAIYTEKDLTIINSRFINNIAICNTVLREMDMYYTEDIGNGGAILCKGELYLEKSNFSNNSASAIVTYNNSNAINCIFENQYSAFLILNDSTTSLINSTFKNGPYSYNYEIRSDYYSKWNLYINNCNFTNCNHGLIRVYPYGNTFINNSIFENNTFENSHYNLIEIDNYTNISNSFFINNSVKDTGILELKSYDLIHCTFINNTDATILSNGILLDDSQNPVYLFEAKIRNNFTKTYYSSGKKIIIDIINVKSKKINWNWIVDVYRNGKYFYDYWFDESITFPVSTWNVGTYNVVVKYQYPQMKTSKITFKITISKAQTIVKVPKITNKYKKSKYFKITVKNKATKNAIKNIKIKLKIYTGKNYKIHTVKTNKNGIAKFNTKSLKVGKHKVSITSGNFNYKIIGKSTITIKK